MTSKAEAVYMASPVWLQNLLVSGMGYKLYRKRYTGLYHRLRQQIEMSRNWSTAERDAWQSQELHNMVRHCRQHIPFYQKLFADHGLHENDVTSLSDLSKIPLLDKQTVRERAPEFRSLQEKPWMTQHTSGSTGTPLALQVNEHTYKLAMALLVDHEERHGIRFGARRATFAGRMVQKPENMRPPFARYNRAENQRLYSAYHLNEQTFPWYRRDLQRFQPQELIGYPSAISDLASYYQNNDSEPGFRPRAVITNSETLLAWQREKIETTFGCPVFDYYGTAEYLLFAGQDNTGFYHASPLPGITEICTTQDHPDSGPILATTLTNTQMPLLRYQIGDTATLDAPRGPGEHTIDTLKDIEGRIDDYIETPDGRRIGRMDHIFKGIRGIREGQIVQDELSRCTARIVLQPGASEFEESVIRSNFVSRAGESMSLSVEIWPQIPRNANGKFKSVISLTAGHAR